jgi:hypothetical protein
VVAVVAVAAHVVSPCHIVEFVAGFVAIQVRVYPVAVAIHRLCEPKSGEQSAQRNVADLVE